MLFVDAHSALNRHRISARLTSIRAILALVVVCLPIVVADIALVVTINTAAAAAAAAF